MNLRHEMIVRLLHYSILRHEPVFRWQLPQYLPHGHTIRSLLCYYPQRGNKTHLQAYADGSFKLVGKNSSFDFNTVTGEMNLEVTNLKISSKVVATKDDVAEVENKVTTLLRIESSKGTAFKNDDTSTVLSVVLYHGNDQITDSSTMKRTFGADAYLQWRSQNTDDNSFTAIPFPESLIFL